MDSEDVEKPALAEEMGDLEGLEVTKGPELLPPPEALDGPIGKKKNGLYSRLRSVLRSEKQE